MKAISEQLSELSLRAKSVEDSFAAAEKEAKEEVAARKAEALTAAKTTVERVNKQIQSVGESAAKSPLSTMRSASFDNKVVRRSRN